MSGTKESWVTTTRAERIEILARKVVASRHDDLDTGSINWVAVLACHMDALAAALAETDATASYSHAGDDARIYPCSLCGTMRSKNEGGTTFTVCDDCYDKHRDAGFNR